MDYIIANHRIRLQSDSVDNTFTRALNVFIAPTDKDAELALDLRTEQQIDLSNYNYKELDTFPFEDANCDCHLGSYTDGYIFRMVARSDGGETIFIYRHDSPIVISNYKNEGATIYRFGLWMMFGIAINPLHSIAIHTSTIRCGEGCVMFLGESGTGKSTHTQLWRKHIAGAYLLNDDSPIMRITDGIATIYGSPWSGKTPCYKNESAPIRAIVRLSQAPHNKIRRLPVISAIGAMLPSCPPSFAFDTKLQDNTCTTLSNVLAQIPVYHLECLPNAEAAELSYKTTFSL